MKQDIFNNGDLHFDLPKFISALGEGAEFRFETDTVTTEVQESFILDIWTNNDVDTYLYINRDQRDSDLETIKELLL